MQISPQSVEGAPTKWTLQVQPPTMHSLCLRLHVGAQPSITSTSRGHVLPPLWVHRVVVSCRLSGYITWSWLCPAASLGCGFTSCCFTRVAGTRVEPVLISEYVPISELCLIPHDYGRTYLRLGMRLVLHACATQQPGLTSRPHQSYHRGSYCSAQTQKIHQM